MNRGYSGFYKDVFLRSSYEYAYAKFLDFHRIKWRYEEKTYILDGEAYKPDFFIYQDGKLLKIVEIKSMIEEEKEKGLKKVGKLEKQIGVKCELISYEELKKFYKKMPFTLHSVIEEWKKSDLTTVQKKWVGKMNPHYGLKHSEETKRKIGEKTKERWEKNDATKKRMIEGLRKSGLTQKGKLKSPREKRECLNCKVRFTVTIKSTQRYCGMECVMENARKKQKENYKKERKVIHDQIKFKIDNWSIANKSLVMSIPYNKIKTNLEPLLNEIENELEVKDIRVITKAVIGEGKGRKELLKYMKELVM